MILENKTSLVLPRKRPVIDLLVVSHKPGIELAPLAENLIIKQVVLDPTVPVWKSKLWNKACDSIGIPCHDVATKGAFVMTMQ
jgi:competence protein ComEC